MLPRKRLHRSVLKYTVSSNVLFAGIVALAPAAARAQSPTGDAPMPIGVFVGSEQERYLRVLQTLGLARLYPWSIRGLSPGEVDYLRPVSDTHPWARRPAFVVPGKRGRALQEVLPPVLNARYNTAFPFGMNDGAVWAGRGATVMAQAGGGVRQGPASIVFAPVAFVAQNRSFPLMPSGLGGTLQFADGRYPLSIDRPQRFGDGTYARLDPGQSTVRLDFRGIAALGVSTANQWWGPMGEYPFILGNNAAGFTHVFIGSATPWNVWIGHLHARVMYGGLGQTGFTDIPEKLQRRFASGLIAVFMPRGVPGLELGAARFFHNVWPDSGLGAREFRRPFEALLKAKLPENDEQGPENQLGSLFGRWVVPRGGFEVYAEYGRDDHNGDTRDLLQEPDHIATYGIGMQKAWARGGDRVTVIRGELMNFEMSTLNRHRGEGGVYTHGTTRQGHTHRGQLLGAGFGINSGAASLVALERYGTSGSDGISWSRLVRQERENVTASSTRCSDACLDVQHVLRATRFRMHGGVEVRYSLAIVYELNRDFVRDAVNWNPEIEVRWHP